MPPLLVIKPVVVISPLISLMQDQALALMAKGNLNISSSSSYIYTTYFERQPYWLELHKRFITQLFKHFYSYITFLFLINYNNYFNEGLTVCTLTSVEANDDVWKKAKEGIA